MGQTHSSANAFHYVEDPQLRDVLLKSENSLDGLLDSSDEAYEITICLDSLSSIDRANVSDTADAFVTFRLQKDPKLPPQLQSSSTRPDTLNPHWEPAEKFRFLVSNMKSNAKILVSVYQHNNGTKLFECTGGQSPVVESDSPLGDAVLKLQDYCDLPSTGQPRTIHVDLTNQLGKHQGKATLLISKLPTTQAKRIDYEVIYEYQRWQLYGWGGSFPGFLLPTDPGSWSNEDGSQFSTSREAVIRETSSGWKSRQQWHVISTTSDPEGWQYAADFSSAFWYDTPGAMRYVRRRSHNRELYLAPEEEETKLQQ